MEREKHQPEKETIQELSSEAGFDKKLLGQALNLQIKQGIGTVKQQPLQSISRVEIDRWDALKGDKRYTATSEGLYNAYKSSSSSQENKKDFILNFTHRGEIITSQTRQDENEPFDAEPGSQNG